MSWLDRITDQLIITTGDGKKYYPSWLNAQKTRDYNYTEFNFPEIEGTLVKRLKPMGAKYNLELFFQGDDHLSVSENFDNSSKNERHWTLEHPFYGLIFVQPTSLNFDNSGYNITKISGTVIETIVEDNNPLTTIDPIDQVPLQKTNLDETAEVTFTEPITTTEVTILTEKTASTYAMGVPVIKLPAQAEEYYQAFVAANTAISTALSSPLLAIRTVTAMLNYPAQLEESVKVRLNLLANQFGVLRESLENLLTPSSKKLYQTNAGSVISAMCLAAATPQANDYKNASAVLLIADQLVDNYDTYLADLDTLQSANGGNTTSYVPSADVLNQLNNLINTTLSALYNIALNSRTERSIITEKDTNIILLTHRLYGLDDDDNNISELMENNGMGLIDLLQIKKGRRIVYYI
jgi:hypothetical protein